MNEKTVVITERDGSYQIQNNGISDFALLGMLECIVFDLKSVGRAAAAEPEESVTNTKQPDSCLEPPETAQPSEPALAETKRGETVPETTAPDVRTRIGNAIKAIRGLGAEIEDTDLSNLTDEELQSELEELTGQYKRLKSTKAKK